MGVSSPNYFGHVNEPDKEPEAVLFRRESEAHQFSLNNSSLSYFDLSLSDSAGQKDENGSSLSPKTPAARLHAGQDAEVMHMDQPAQLRLSPTRFPAERVLIGKRDRSTESSKPQSSKLAALDDRHARNSLPINKPDQAELSIARSETLPAILTTDSPTFIPPQTVHSILQNYPTEDILVIDLRVSHHYVKSRIAGAINLCIPTTLSKRPSYNLQKLATTFGNPSDRAKFERWRDTKAVIVYDAAAFQMSDAAACVNILNKFGTEDWDGATLIIRGGFNAFAKHFPRQIDSESLSIQPASPATKLRLTTSTPPHLAKAAFSPNHSLPSVGPPPLAGGCLMPVDGDAVNPFFGNIRQNMDLIDGVGRFPITRPASLGGKTSSLPAWLRQVSNPDNQGKLVAKRFLRIEQNEQHRMRLALTARVTYGSPHPKSPTKVQVAGIEQGTKNRYKDILPFEHSRVKLQDQSSGESDYVNASHIKAPSGSSKRYISAQAPIPSTFQDFWRAVWEQDVRTIVMLTAEKDGGHVKSHPYWNSGQYGCLQLVLESVSEVHIDPTQTVTIRSIRLMHERYPEDIRTITQIQYADWPDFGAPAHPAELLALLKYVNDTIAMTENRLKITSVPDQSPSSRRLLVHCSAGCGRTGTFCTVDTVLNMLELGTEMTKDENSDLVAYTVEHFRGQRISMVQTLRQFALCYETVLEWFGQKFDERAR